MRVTRTVATTINTPPTPSRRLSCSAGSSTIAMAADQSGVVANSTCAWVGDTLLCACDHGKDRVQGLDVKLLSHRTAAVVRQAADGV